MGSFYRGLFNNTKLDYLNTLSQDLNITERRLPFNSHRISIHNLILLILRWCQNRTMNANGTVIQYFYCHVLFDNLILQFSFAGFDSQGRTVCMNAPPTVRE